MQLVKGEIYRQNNGVNRFCIEHRWSSNLFSGRRVGASNVPTGHEYLFNSVGEALGWKGNDYGTASLGWRLQPDVPQYEYRLVYEGLVDTQWTRLTKATPRYVYSSSQFLIRETGNNASVRLIGLDEFKKLQAASPTA